MMRLHSMGRPGRRAFTLIELLAVVAIIGILAALLFPFASSMRRKADVTADLARVKALSSGVMSYLSENNNELPYDITNYRQMGKTGTVGGFAAAPANSSLRFVNPYIGGPFAANDPVTVCLSPLDRKRPVASQQYTQTGTSYFMNYSFPTGSFHYFNLSNQNGTPFRMVNVQEPSKTILLGTWTAHRYQGGTDKGNSGLFDPKVEKASVAFCDGSARTITIAAPGSTPNYPDTEDYKWTNRPKN